MRPCHNYFLSFHIQNKVFHFTPLTQYIIASLLPFVLAAAGGAMLYVISDEMIPETHSHGFEKGATFALLAGFLLVMILQRMMEGL